MFSVPWLKKFIDGHPHVSFRISYVQNASFGEKAMRTLSGDMKLRDRNDLIGQVKAQQTQIALLIVGMRYAEAYWLVFPDKHLLLWRYIGPSGLLKWSPSDFKGGGMRRLSRHRAAQAGKSAPDGTLVPAERAARRGWCGRLASTTCPGWTALRPALRRWTMGAGDSSIRRAPL